MNLSFNRQRLVARAGVFLVFAGILLSACGVMIDKNRIVVASIAGENFTRGDLFAMLRRMGDTDRPRIRNKADLIRVINNHIDDQVRLKLAEDFAANSAQLGEMAQRIYVPISVATARYINESGDEMKQVQMILTAPLPAAGEETELMRTYGMDHRQWRARRDFYESRIESLRDKMQGDALISYHAAEDFKAGKLKLDPAALEREYSVRKSTLHRFESLAFFAIEFPAAVSTSTEEASKVRARIDAGESFDAVAAEFQAKNANSVSNSAIENNPNLDKFRSFWGQASGAEPGAILGPVFLPSSGRVRIDAQGRPVQYQAPDSYLVLKVLEHQPERELTLQEATPEIAPELLYAAKLNALRDEMGVKIFEDQIPDPRSEGSGTGDPVLGY